MSSLSNISPERVREAIVTVLVLIASVAFHEFGHAWMADRLGDDTPRREGRVTLNPIAHADPIGTIMLPIAGVLFGSGAFGWGRPVNFNAARVRRGITMAKAQILVAIAGPAMNILIAVVVGTVHAVLLAKGAVQATSEVSTLLFSVVSLNFLLFFFNLLPIPPLDGGHVARSFTPYRYRAQFAQFERYGLFIIVLFMVVPSLQVVFRWPADFCAEHLYHLLFRILM